MITTDATAAGVDGHYLHHGSPDRAGNYADKSERVKFSSARHLAGDPEDRHQMTKQLQAQAALSDSVEKPYFHAKLSLDSGETTGREPERLELDDWNQVRDAYAEKMGLSRHQCWMVVHQDKPHEHAHLYFNRVGAEGAAWNPWRSHTRSQDAAREIEAARGLRRVQGTLGRYTGEELGPSDVGQRAAPERGSQVPSAAVAEYQRTGEVPFSMQAKGAKEDLRASESWHELEGRLAARGMELEESGGGAVLRKTGGEAKHRAPLWKIDRESTFPKLKQRLGPYHERERGHEQRPRTHKGKREAQRARSGPEQRRGAARSAENGRGRESWASPHRRHRSAPERRREAQQLRHLTREERAARLEARGARHSGRGAGDARGGEGVSERSGSDAQGRDRADGSKPHIRQRRGEGIEDVHREGRGCDSYLLQRSRPGHPVQAVLDRPVLSDGRSRHFVFSRPARQKVADLALTLHAGQ